AFHTYRRRQILRHRHPRRAHPRTRRRLRHGSGLSRLYGLHRLTEAGAFFIVRAWRKHGLRRLASRPVDRATGVVCDQIVRFAWRASAKKYPDRLRRIRFRDHKTARTMVFLTNNFTLPARVVTELYRCRWQVELFFKWIKQHLRIKSFFGTSE